MRTMINISEGQRLGAPPTVVASIHDEGLVLLHTEKGRVFVANRTGTRIWQGLERRLPVDALAAEISREYQIAQETAREHTVRFLAELLRQGLITASADR